MFRLGLKEEEQGEVVGEWVRGWRTDSPDICLLSSEGHTMYTKG